MYVLRNPSKLERIAVIGCRCFQKELLVRSSFTEFGIHHRYINTTTAYNSSDTIITKTKPNFLSELSPIKSTSPVFLSVPLQFLTFPSSSRQITTFTLPLLKKSRSTSRSIEDDEDERKQDEDDEELDVMGKGDKVIKVRLLSDRLDAVLKACLQLSRNKIEKAFYADRIRVNGERPKKKSQLVGEGDEVDVIRRYNSKNPQYLDVSRLEILEMGSYSRTENEDSDDDAKIPAKIRRSKNLTIENYETPFKGNLDDS